MRCESVGPDIWIMIEDTGEVRVGGQTNRRQGERDAPFSL